MLLKIPHNAVFASTETTVLPWRWDAKVDVNIESPGITDTVGSGATACREVAQ